MVAGLTPGEQYVFRVRAENAHGLSEASSESEPFLVGPDGEWQSNNTIVIINNLWSRGYVIASRSKVRGFKPS